MHMLILTMFHTHELTHINTAPHSYIRMYTRFTIYTCPNPSTLTHSLTHPPTHPLSHSHSKLYNAKQNFRSTGSYSYSQNAGYTHNTETESAPDYQDKIPHSHNRQLRTFYMHYHTDIIIHGTDYDKTLMQHWLVHNMPENVQPFSQPSALRNNSHCPIFHTQACR